MAHKDYIKRGNPNAKNRPKARSKGKKATANKNAAPEKQPLPLIAMGLAVIILSSFGYFLWSINGAAKNTPQGAEVAQVEQPSPAPAKTVKPKPKKQIVPTTITQAIAEQPDVPPPPEKEDWQYIEELKKKEVEVEVSKIEKKGPFVMQCATFREARRAEAFRAQLALLGFESRIKVTQSSSGGKRHRVQLGPYEMNRDAQRARHKLSKHKINGCKIWLWT